MADWAEKGAPNKSAFIRVLASLEADEDRSWLDDDANALQAIAVAECFAQRSSDAAGHLEMAEQAARAGRGRDAVSCWSYTRVPTGRFLEHCGEIRRLLAGEDVTPEFMRAAGGREDGG